MGSQRDKDLVGSSLIRHDSGRWGRQDIEKPFEHPRKFTRIALCHLAHYRVAKAGQT